MPRFCSYPSPAYRHRGVPGACSCERTRWLSRPARGTHQQTVPKLSPAERSYKQGTQASRGRFTAGTRNGSVESRGSKVEHVGSEYIVMLSDRQLRDGLIAEAERSAEQSRATPGL